MIDGDQRIAQCMDHGNVPARQAFRASRSDVVLVQHFEHRGAGHPCDDRQRNGAERDRRQDQMRQRGPECGEITGAQRVDQHEPRDAGTSYSTAMRPETGVQPRCTKKNRISSSAHQKIGIE